MIEFVVEDGSGIATATSYVSVEEADGISRLNIHSLEVWENLAPIQKEYLLMYASRALDARALWNGGKTASGQGLEWPRTGVVDRYQNAVSASSVPYNVRWAVVEIAKANIATDKLSTGVPANAVSEIKIDTITVKFAEAASIAAAQFNFPDIVKDLLRGLGSFRNSVSKISFGKVVRT